MDTSVVNPSTRRSGDRSSVTPGWLTGARPRMLTPPQSARWRTAAALVHTIGLPTRPTALILPPGSTTSAEGGSVTSPLTIAPGSTFRIAPESTIEYYRHGNVDVRAAIILAASMFAGAWVGAYFANQMKGPHPRLLFGVFISALGAYLIFGASRRLGWI